jgi:peptidoglycan/LPS O-acetylase OafA/YrhL
MTAPLEGTSRHNNFDILRLSAAIMVVSSHSFAAINEYQPSSFLDPFGNAWSYLGVLIFFSISGYLIAQSWVRDPSPGRYFAKRGSRIFPALLVATAFTSLVLGVFTTNVNLLEYFGSPNTWLYPIVKTLLFIPGNVDPPGIFHDTPTGLVNPSLWTLPVEFACYVAIMVALLARAPAWRLTATGLGAVMGGALSVQPIWSSTPLAPLTDHAVFNYAIVLATAFFTGAFLSLCVARWGWRFSPIVAALFAVVLVLASHIPSGSVLLPLFAPYIVLTLALGVPAVPLGRLRGWDLSYAVYLYGFPIQQVIVQVTHTTSALLVFGLAVAILIPLAALSWRFVERPSLELVKRTLAAHRGRTSIAVAAD